MLLGAQLHCVALAEGKGGRGVGGGYAAGSLPTASDAPGAHHVRYCQYTYVQVARSSWLCRLASRLAARRTWCRMLPQLPAQPSSCSPC